MGVGSKDVNGINMDKVNEQADDHVLSTDEEGGSVMNETIGRWNEPSGGLLYWQDNRCGQGVTSVKYHHTINPEGECHGFYIVTTTSDTPYGFMESTMRIEEVTGMGWQ